MPLEPVVAARAGDMQEDAAETGLGELGFHRPLIMRCRPYQCSCRFHVFHFLLPETASNLSGKLKFFAALSPGFTGKTGEIPKLALREAFSRRFGLMLTFDKAKSRGEKFGESSAFFAN